MGKDIFFFLVMFKMQIYGHILKIHFMLRS